MPKILDCTLRDGGYINNWEFPKNSAKEIIKCLQMAKIDLIEIGFYHKNIENIIPNDCSNIVAMVQFSKTPINKIKDIEKSKIKSLRVIFKKFESEDALKYCNEIKSKGYRLFINATFISQYQENELINLFKKVNKINPYALTVTDSMGVFTSFDIKKISKIIKNELNPNIALCFHAHNNLGLAFSNAKTFMELNKERELITDSCLYGMGRGAGNIHTENLIRYLNQKGAKYEIKPVFYAIEKYILPMYIKTPWGISIPYYLSALYKCHPNYAKDIIEKNIKFDKIDKIFTSIPYEKKVIYDNKLISQEFIKSLV